MSQSQLYDDYVWKADRFGLLYSQSPQQTLATDRSKGLKVVRSLSTCLSCFKNSGSECTTFMSIDESLNPRAFGLKLASNLGFNYNSHYKNWMTYFIFFEMFYWFDSYIWRNRCKKAMVILDKCKAHGSKEVLPSLSNEIFRLQPPSETIHIQPCHTGIIAFIKRIYMKPPSNADNIAILSATR